jgi:hypothetical protein
MAIETKCQTPGTDFHTTIGKRVIGMTVVLPFRLDIDEEEAEVLYANLHNVIELVLTKYFPKNENQGCKSNES